MYDICITVFKCLGYGANPIWLTGHDFYIVKPDKTVPIFSYTPGLANMKFSSAASAFSSQAWHIIAPWLTHV